MVADGWFHGIRYQMKTQNFVGVFLEKVITTDQSGFIEDYDSKLWMCVPKEISIHRSVYD